MKDNEIQTNGIYDQISEFITEKSLANLGTCAALCAMITQAFKLLFPMLNPLFINLFAATILSLSKLLISDNFTLKNIGLSILNIFPIALTAGGGYDALKYILVK